jgi:MerR family redox-sensitive transcriptional activator SoxR
MTELTIGEVARRAGLNASALRWYERVGLLPAPRRVVGRRRYDPGVLHHLAAIRLAREAGFTIAEIRDLLAGFEPGSPPAAIWHDFATRKRTELEQVIARAERTRALLDDILDCDCPTLDRCDLVAGRAAPHLPAGTLR